MSTQWPVQRHDDAEMYDAIIREIAQYVLRGEAHQTAPAHTDTEVLNRAMRALGEAAADGYTFSRNARHFAATAQEFADWQRDHNPNWDDWAFGH